MIWTQQKKFACQQGQVKARRLGYAVDAAEGVPGRVDQVSGLKLVLVRDEGQLRVWNELVEREHAKGAAVHVGAQLRYLIDSEHDLGAIGCRIELDTKSSVARS